MNALRRCCQGLVGYVPMTVIFPVISTENGPVFFPYKQGMEGP